MAKKEKEQIERIPFRLERPHRHAGVERKPGEEIELRPDQVERLTAAGVGKRA